MGIGVYAVVCVSILDRGGYGIGECWNRGHVDATSSVKSSITADLKVSDVVDDILDHLLHSESRPMRYGVIARWYVRSLLKR